MRVIELVTELQLPKNKWEMLWSTSDKEEVGQELVDLVKHAYSITKYGSFINQLKDVIPSDWAVIDWDKDPDVDATVFYRVNRSNESWVGNKIQGLGHDGTRMSKDKAILKIQELLSKPGWWIESSDALRNVLKKLNVSAVDDEKLLQKLFKDPDLKMIDNDTYTRKLQSGNSVKESVFGKPKLK